MTSPINLGGKRTEFDPASIVFRGPNNTAELESVAGLVLAEYKRRKYYKNKTLESVLSELECGAVKGAWIDSTPLSTVASFREESLPMDEIFRTELDQLRNRGLKVGEISKCAGQATLPIVMAVMSDAFCDLAPDVDVIAINVNPRHKRFYLELAGFRRLVEGEDFRSNPAVSGAPAIGLFGYRDEILASPGARMVMTDQKILKYRQPTCTSVPQ